MTPPSDQSFGLLLRRYRQDCELTQEDLAERAGLSRRTISDLERGLKATPQPATLQLLVDALQLSETDRKAFLESVPRRRRRREPEDVAPLDSTLPADLTPLVGREHDEAACVHLLGNPGLRLLTLVGPGGVGKSRLAVRVAETVSSKYADGANLVSLAPATSADEVPVLIARALDIQDRTQTPALQRLSDHLRSKEKLLVLDNFEHVVGGDRRLESPVGDMSKTYGARDQPRTTQPQGRAALRSSAPSHCPTRTISPPWRPLATPPWPYLFREAKATMPHFALNDDLVSTVSEICRRCDGLPLAIELAAARARYVPLEEIVSRLRTGDYSVRSYTPWTRLRATRPSLPPSRGATTS